MKSLEIHVNGVYAEKMYSLLQLNERIKFEFQGWDGNDAYFKIKAPVQRIIEVVRNENIPYFIHQIAWLKGTIYKSENDFKPENAYPK